MSNSLIPLLPWMLFAPAAAWNIPTISDAKEYLYVGTSNSRGSEGLYVFAFDRHSETLTLIQTVGNRRGLGFQALHPNGASLYSISSHRFVEGGDQGTLSAYRIDRATGRLSLIDEQPVFGSTHLSVDPLGRFLYVSDYGGGRLSVFGIRDDGGPSETIQVVQHEGAGIHPERQTAPHIHSAVPSPDGKFVYASSLGLDRIFIYSVDPMSGRLTPAATPYVETVPQSGPRHFAVHPAGAFAFSVEEISHSVAAYQRDSRTGELNPVDRRDLLPEGVEVDRASAADIHLSPDGRFLYVSNRGHDSLVIYEIDSQSGRLEIVGHEPIGDHSRSFAVDPKGEFLFVANRDDDNVYLLRRESNRGTLAYIGSVDVPAPACVTHAVFD